MPEEAIQHITVSGVPKPLVENIDELAKTEHRNRSSFIVKILSDAVKARRKRPVAPRR